MTRKVDKAGIRKIRIGFIAVGVVMLSGCHALLDPYHYHHPHGYYGHHSNHHGYYDGHKKRRY